MQVKTQMIQMALKQLEPSPHPVRMSWSEEAMDELTQSIKEQGVIVPIKVRPISAERFDAVTQRLISAKWEIVYGHRRVEASRRAGLRYINVVIEDMDDQATLMQALTENVQRKNLTNAEEGLAYIRLRDECNLKRREIAQKVGKHETWIGQCILLVEDPSMKKLIHCISFDAANKAKAIRGAMKDDLVGREAFATKIVDESLTTNQTRDLAAELKGTQDPLARARILATPIADVHTVADAVKLIIEDEREREKSRQAYLNVSPCAKNFIQHIRVNKHDWKRAWQDVERGALGIEHMPYVEEHLRKYAEFIIELADDLNARREEAVGGP